MAGTDHAQNEGWQGQQPAFVLVRPQLGENIGAAARAMWNFGLDRMRLVAPRDGWPNPAAVATASGAAQVLDNIQLSNDLPEALADCTYVFATTARPRGLTKPVVTPQRAMEQARALSAEGQKVAILFGPERAGLENADVMRANAIVSVPVNPGFGSLNLGQCVLLMAYEWRRQGEAVPAEVLELAGARLATQIEVEKLYDRLHASLDRLGFFWPEHKADSMAVSLRNLISRMPMTDVDIRTWHGVIRTLAGRQNDPD